MRAAMLEVEPEPQMESPYSAAETNWGGDSSDATSVEQCAWEPLFRERMSKSSITNWREREGR